MVFGKKSSVDHPVNCTFNGKRKGENRKTEKANASRAPSQFVPLKHNALFSSGGGDVMELDSTRGHLKEKEREREKMQRRTDFAAGRKEASKERASRRVKKKQSGGNASGWVA